MSAPERIVFVVDDDPLVCDSIADLLGSAGIAAQTFGSAIEFMRARRPDISACLILDLDLPGLSGLDLQTELARSGIELPIIFLTGHGDIPKSVRAMKAGAMEFLTKPFRATVRLLHQRHHHERGRSSFYQQETERIRHSLGPRQQSLPMRNAYTSPARGHGGIWTGRLT